VAMFRLTTHSTGARVSRSFIVNLNLSALCARPVNSGVRRLIFARTLSLIRSAKAKSEKLSLCVFHP
jgi:hypothetical protein